MGVVRKLWGAAVFLALLLAAAWVALDVWQGQPSRPEWLRIAVLVMLGLGALGLVHRGIQALRGKGRVPFLTLLRDSLGSTAVSLISLWVFWHAFVWVQRPGVQRIAEPVAGVFGKRVGFWIFWIVVVPLGAAVLLYFCHAIFQLLSGPFRKNEPAEEEEPTGSRVPETPPGDARKS